MNLIFHHAALGDFVLTFPLLRSLDETTTIVSSWQKAALAAAQFKHVQPMDIEMLEFTRLFAQGGPTSMSPVVTEAFEQARRIISFISTGEDTWADNVRRLAPQAELLIVHPRPPQDFQDHVTEFHREQLKHQGLSLPNPKPIRAIKRSRGAVLLHPGSGGKEKRWPVDRWIALSQHLKTHGHTVKIIVGEVEQQDTAMMQSLEQTGEAKACTTTLDLIDELDKAQAYIGNDAGPTHLAAQLGLPTLALFGPTHPRIWQPLGPRVTTLAPKCPSPMDWLETHAVIDAADAMLTRE